MDQEQGEAMNLTTVQSQRVQDQARKGSRSETPTAPIADLLGFTLASLQSGHVVIDFEATERHANPMGTLHGGVLAAVADAAMGVAYISILAEGESFTTLEMKINFLKPVWNARLRAVGKIVKAGRTVGLVECDVTDHEGRLVARASSTCMTLRDDQARGR